MKKIGNLEVRYSKLNQGYELVQWFDVDNDNKHCIVVAFFQEGSEGCNIEFVGSRPFNTGESLGTLWALLKYGQTIVDAEFELDAVFE